MRGTIVLAVLLVLAGCGSKLDSVIGPAGPEGPAGANGTNGTSPTLSITESIYCTKSVTINRYIVLLTYVNKTLSNSLHFVEAEVTTNSSASSANISPASGTIFVTQPMINDSTGFWTFTYQNSVVQVQYTSVGSPNNNYSYTFIGADCIS